MRIEGKQHCAVLNTGGGDPDIVDWYGTAAQAESPLDVGEPFGGGVGDGNHDRAGPFAEASQYLAVYQIPSPSKEAVEELSNDDRREEHRRVFALSLLELPVLFRRHRAE